jgi:polyferredoxin
MRRRPGWVAARKTVQAAALIAFVALFVLARGADLSGDVANVPMRLDPLLQLSAAVAARAVVAGSLIALITLGLTLVFGRAWCGWLCPLGSVLDMFTPKRGTARARSVPEGWRKVKYVVLLTVLFAALLGNQTLLFLDPLAIFQRTLATAVWPALDQVVTAIESLLSSTGLDGPVSSADSAVRPLLLPADPLAYQDALLFGLFFVGLVGLNTFAPRFWCRYLCPLGGFLGLISRVAIFRRRVSESCGGCAVCEDDCPTGTIDPARDYASDPAECTACMKCVSPCPFGSVAFKPGFSVEAGRPYDPGRRGVLVGLGTSVAAVALFRSDLLTRRESPFLLRPPGSREMNADAVALTDCTRCGECIHVCPTGVLQPAVFQAGLQGLGTPVLVPSLGYCDYACNVCGAICPTNAIPLLSLEVKQRQVVGKAFIDESRCLAWSDHIECLVCQEMCPLPDKAIQLEPQDVWAPGGGTVTIQMPHVVRDMCIGCGLCEYRCPVSGDAAIRVYVPYLPTPF